MLLFLVQSGCIFIFHGGNLAIFGLNLFRTLLKSCTTLFDQNLQLFLSFRSFQKNKHLWINPVNDFLESYPTTEVIFNTHRCSLEFNLKIFMDFFQLLIVHVFVILHHLLLVSDLFLIHLCQLFSILFINYRSLLQNVCFFDHPFQFLYLCYSLFSGEFQALTFLFQVCVLLKQFIKISFLFRYLLLKLSYLKIS